MEITSHSPDLVPCDFRLNDYIKRNLTDRTNEEFIVQEVSKIVKNILEKEFKILKTNC
jgi:hypothetical protein